MLEELGVAGIDIETGKLHDVIVVIDNKLEKVCDAGLFGSYIIERDKAVSRLIVWADKGMKRIIKSVPGVISVDKSGYKQKYIVDVDPRYDTTWVIEEIKASVMCVYQDEIVDNSENDQAEI